MRILIDADACPVVRQALAIAKKYVVEVILFCDTSHVMEYERAVTVTVGQGGDAADFALVNRTEAGDLVVTQDYGVAAMALAKGAYCLNQNGMVYDYNNIDTLLLDRYVAKKVRMAGGRTTNAKKRKKEADEAFSKALDTLCQKIINSEK